MQASPTNLDEFNRLFDHLSQLVRQNLYPQVPTCVSQVWKGLPPVRTSTLTGSPSHSLTYEQPKRGDVLYLYLVCLSHQPQVPQDVLDLTLGSLQGVELSDYWPMIHGILSNVSLPSSIRILPILTLLRRKSLNQTYENILMLQQKQREGGSGEDDTKTAHGSHKLCS